VPVRVGAFTAPFFVLESAQSRDGWGFALLGILRLCQEDQGDVRTTQYV
jgi:hypothetical protein